MKYFKIEESVYHPGKYLLTPIHEKLNLKKTIGSYNVFPARLLNLTYANYLRYCRDAVGAELIGKKCYYVVPYFNDLSKLKEFIKELDSRVDMIKK